jgi:HSP20 family protein
LKNTFRKMPWHELARQFLGEDFFEDMQTAARQDEPAADVYHGENEVIVVVNLPGLENVRALDLKLEGNNLIIQGDYPSPYEGYQTIFSERKKGMFKKVIPLQASVSKRYTHARYRRGVLEIRFPKKPKQNRSLQI